MSPRVSVVIPTWNGADLLRVSLPSLTRQTFRDFELIVADNGSTDDTDAAVREHPTPVRLIRLPENRGFAAAVNAGIRAANGECIVLMNNDTEAAPGWLEALVAALDAHADVGFCASRVMEFERRDHIDSAGDKMGVLADQIGHGQPDAPLYRRPRYVLSACAGAAAYRARLFQDVGLFDERFGSYLEDVDLGLRAQLAGYRCLYVPDAVIYHMGSATAQRLPARKMYFLVRNSLFLFFQYLPKRVWLRWTLPVLAVLFASTRRWGHPTRVALAAVRDFLRELPAVLRRRRAVRARRRIDDAELLALLSPPVGSWSPERAELPEPVREAG